MTSAADSLDLALLRQLTVLRKPASLSTSFENQYRPDGRVQTLLTRAMDLELADVPESWRSAEIVHLAPIAREVHPDVAGAFPRSFVGVTPQGSMRSWDSTGRVSLRPWETVRDLIEQADAVVLSLEDLQLDRSAAASMATHCKTLVVTEGSQGAMLYEPGRVRSVPTIPASEVDPTGAGDVFAAVFFIRLHESGDAWESAVLASQIAAKSVSRPGLAGAPTPTEARAVLQATGNR